VIAGLSREDAKVTMGYPGSTQTVDRDGYHTRVGRPGRGSPPIGANLPRGCNAFLAGYRRGSSSVEPHVGSGERGVSPGSARTVDRCGYRPGGGGSVWRYPGKTLPGAWQPPGANRSGSHRMPPDRDQDRFQRWRRAIDRRLTSNTQNRPSSPESSVILMNLHTKR